MKAELIYKTRNHSVPLPNAATRQQITHRVLDGFLMAACGAGIGAMILLMLAMA